MRIQADEKITEAEITSDHPASSYGQPVLLVNGVPMSPGETMLAEIDLFEASTEERRMLRRGGYCWAEDMKGKCFECALRSYLEAAGEDPADYGL